MVDRFTGFRAQAEQRTRDFITMKFRFPIVIIDEDFRSENTSGLGIRALANAIEGEGMEVLGADLKKIMTHRERN